MRGRLRHKVTLQRQDTTQNAVGERTLTYTDLATRRVRIEPLNGREYFEEGAEKAEVTARIRLRYDNSLSDLGSGDRVVHGAVVYDIKSVINVEERNRELVLMCDRDGG